MLAVLLLLHLYIASRLLPDLPFGIAGAGVGAVVLIASAALIPCGFRLRRFAATRRAKRLMWAGLIALGAFSTLLVLTFARDAVLLVVHGVDALEPGAIAEAGLAHASAAFIPVATALLTLIGFVNARRVAHVRNVDVPIASLPPALHGFTIAQITDVHVGPTIGRDYVESVVAEVNALAPAIVAVTGDLVDGSVEALAQHTEPLARLVARHGVYFVTGNHEYYSGADAWIAELRRLGVTVLLNEHVVLAHDGALVVVAGVTDHSAHHFDPSHRSDPARAMSGAPSRRPEAPARPPAAFGLRGRIRRIRPAALRSHARGPVPAVEFLRTLPAAVHGRSRPPREALGLHEPGHRLLGTAETSRGAVRDHVPATGRGMNTMIGVGERTGGGVICDSATPPPAGARGASALRASVHPGQRRLADRIRIDDEARDRRRAPFGSRASRP